MEKQTPFHQQLRHEREVRGWSQADLASKVGSDVKTVARWESGKSLPRPYFRQMLHGLFGKDAEELGLLGEQAGGTQTMTSSPGTTGEPSPSPLQSPTASEIVVSSEDKTILPRQPISVIKTENGPFHSIFTEVDWGGAPDITNFYGREKELAKLEQWIASEHCRIVAVLGMGGFGKTALSAKLVEQMKDTFEFIFWRSLQNAPPPEHILKQCILFVSDQQYIGLPQELDDQISLLAQYLRFHRCLLILDNIESVLASGRPAGQYREGYEGYGRLIQRVGEVQHQSTLLLTGREKPKEVAHLEGKTSPVRSLYLSGVGPNEGREILKNKELFGTDEQWRTLVDLYSGNPLALKLVAASIREVLGGNIARFLQEEETAFGDINDLLDQQFHRLSMQEREILYWLAIERDAVALEDVRKNLLYPVPKGILLEALVSLRRRSMIESRDAVHFTLQPVILEYVTMDLVRRICEDFDNEAVGVWVNYAFVKAQAKDYVRDSQIRLILTPVAQYLLATLGKQDTEQKLRNLLSLLRQMPPEKSGYAAGNALNLLVHLRSDLRSFDFSHLMIRQAYLQNVILWDVNFANAHFVGSAFTSTFGNILSVACSPDGNLIAAGTATGEIYIFQALSGMPHLTLYGHTDGVWSVAFNQDGCIVASSSDDQTIRLWDCSTGKCIITLQNHTNRVRAVTFSPDERMLASGSDDQTVRLWDVQTGECLKILQGHMNRVWSVAFDPQGKVLASASTDRTIRLWDNDTGECLKILQGHTNWVRSIAFSPDGNTLGSGSDDQLVCIWDINAGKCLKRLQGHSSRIWSVAFNLRGNILASGSEDRTVRLWDTDTGQCMKTLQGHAQGVRSLTFNSDGLTLVSGGDDQTIRLWDAFTGECLKTLQGYTNRIWSVIFSPRGNILVTSSEDQTIRLWDMSTGRSYKAFQDRSHGVKAVAFSPDGQMLASGGEDQTVRLWDIQRGDCLNILHGHTNWVRAVAFSPDGHMLASGGEDQTVRLWNVHTGKCRNTLRGHTNWVRTVAFSPDGHTLATGSDDQTIRLWEPDTGYCIRMLQGHTGRVRSVAFSPDGQMLASGGEDQTVRLWDIQKGDCLKTLRSHANRVRWITFDSNGGRLASSSDDGTIKLWDARTGECLKTFISERPYERMNITNAEGLTEAQKASLRALGAIEEKD